MSGAERRKELIKYIAGSGKAASGTLLAQNFHVSRQVIVQDIALLRAEGYDIISTNRGYLCSRFPRASRVFYVHHDADRLIDELNLIVDIGGCVKDVFVMHEIYGELRAELNVDSRKKASVFVEGISSGTSIPLNTITDGYHYHTVTAESEEVLDSIEEELRAQKFLIDDNAEKDRN